MTTAQPTNSITEAAVSESELSANRDEQQDNQFMEVDDSLEPMVLLAPDGGEKSYDSKLSFKALKAVYLVIMACQWSVLGRSNQSARIYVCRQRVNKKK